jgi:uncharacterized repeat protein (TIGR01451 family)
MASRRRRLGLLVAGALILAALPLALPAQAALNHTISVTINEINCGSACDGEGIEGPLDGPPDWFARVFIDGGEAVPPRQDGPDDKAKINPNWVFTKTVPATQKTVDVRIQIWDRDGGSDDLADSTPQFGDKNLDFTVDTVTNRVAGEIGGAVGVQLCTFGNGEDSDGSAFVCFTAGTGDRDGDGLQDAWETSGIDFDGVGGVDLALNAPPFNANPDRKDLFMEVDYMACSAGGCAAGDVHTHRPAAGALGDVVAAFAAAPVDNPDGSQGITLHALEDEALAEVTQVLFQSNGAGTNDDFNDIKNGNPAGACTGSFGTAAERASPNCVNILAAKRGVFQYVIFGHSYTEAPTSSGISELSANGGNDLMVTLGGFGAGGVAAAGGQRPADASTLMHEYGHNLSLGHGGFEGKNCKPNYLSIMSYSFQFANIDNARPMDYSRDALPMLNETALPTSGGVGGPAGQNTIFGQAGNAVVRPANGPIDWDGSGGTTADVDFISAINPGCQNPSPGDTNMQGWDDWQNLVYNFRSSTMFADGASRTSPVEITNETVIAMTPLADLNATKSVDKATAQPGDTLTYTVTAGNGGPGKAVGVKITDTLPDGTSQEQAVGELTAGSSSMKTFSYSIPCVTADGTTLTNQATVTGTNLALVADPNATNNSASATTTVQAPKLTLTKSSSASANAGEAITYTLTYENTGSAGATNAVVTDVLPAEVYYSLALDQGAGPKPDTVVVNGDGTTTLTWNVGAVAASSGPQTISYTARPSLLVLGGSSVQNGAGISFANANGCSYTGPAASATSAVTQVAPSRDPLTHGYWRTHPEEWTAEILARIQATDQRFDGADGTTPDGVLASSEVAAVLAPSGGMPRITVQQLLAVYFNLATRRINASTGISSRTTVRLGLANVRAAALYAKATLALPLGFATQARYSDTTQVLDEINRNRSEVY